MRAPERIRGGLKKKKDTRKFGWDDHDERGMRQTAGVTNPGCVKLSPLWRGCFSRPTTRPCGNHRNRTFEQNKKLFIKETLDRAL